MNDPDEGLRLFSHQNEEAAQQTHREVARRVHNFAAASLTLVEHTRIFMREHYNDTAILGAYQAKIDAEFANDPLVRFVQDLRNFMLHRGPPASEMFLHFSGGVLASGIHIKTSQLLTWDQWSVPARRFIENSGEFFDIRTFAEDYTNKVVSLHSWLAGELDQFHMAYLAELQALQTKMAQLEAHRTQGIQSV